MMSFATASSFVPFLILSSPPPDKYALRLFKMVPLAKETGGVVTTGGVALGVAAGVGATGDAFVEATSTCGGGSGAGVGMFESPEASKRKKKTMLEVCQEIVI